MEKNPNEKKMEYAYGSIFLPGAAIILLVLTVFFGYKYFTFDKKLGETKSAILAECQDQKKLDFALLFIDKVLQADKEVDFDTRLQLENSVRALDDKEILVQWQKFTAAPDEKSAQTEVKNLLRMIVEKAKG